MPQKAPKNHVYPVNCTGRARTARGSSWTVRCFDAAQLPGRTSTCMRAMPQASPSDRSLHQLPAATPVLLSPCMLRGLSSEAWRLCCGVQVGRSWGLSPTTRRRSAMARDLPSSAGSWRARCRAMTRCLIRGTLAAPRALSSCSRFSVPVLSASASASALRSLSGLPAGHS